MWMNKIKKLSDAHFRFCIIFYIKKSKWPIFVKQNFISQLEVTICLVW